MIRWSFDSLCVAAAVSEARRLVGDERVRCVRERGDRTWLIEFGRHRQVSLCLKTAPEYPCFFVSKLTSTSKPQRGFGHQLYMHLQGARLVHVEQIGFDRIIRCTFAKADQQRRLYACLFGTHAAAALCDDGDRVLVAERRHESFPVGRNIQLPASSMHSIDQALKEPEGVGSRPFVLAVRLHGDAVLKSAQGGDGWLHQDGPYPLCLDAAAKRCASFSDAAESWLLRLEKERAAVLLEKQRASVRRRMEALKAARDHIEAVLHAGNRAEEYQRKGEIILAFQSQIPPGSSSVVLPDFEGGSQEIRLNPDLTPVENAEQYFAKAKRAKNAMPSLQERLQQIDEQICVLEKRLAEHELYMPLVTEGPAPKRFEGNKIKEYESPSGYRILVGLSANANDYLTRRIAKPNDWWLHARGATGAHVIILTNNHPERVPKETLEYAARLAARHSSQKHANVVPVAYTLAKYVRKPKKAAPGTVVLTMEKVLFVSPQPID